MSVSWLAESSPDRQPFAMGNRFNNHRCLISADDGERAFSWINRDGCLLSSLLSVVCRSTPDDAICCESFCLLNLLLCICLFRAYWQLHL